MFRCKDLMMLPSFSKVKLISGQSGLSNTIRWVYKPENMNFSKWVRGHELLIVSAPVIRTNEFDLMKLLKKATSLQMSGMLLLVGNHYIESIPDDIISYSNKNSFPIFSMSAKVPLIDIFEEIGHAIAYDDQSSSGDSALFTDVVFGNAFDTDKFIDKCAKYDYDITGRQRMFIIRLESTAMAQSYDYENILEIIKKCFEKAKINVIATRFGSSCVGALKAETADDEKNDDIQKANDEVSCIKEVYLDIKNSINSIYDGWTIGMGVGSACTYPDKLHDSYAAASECIKILEKLSAGNGVYVHEEIGMYSIFMKSADKTYIHEFVEYTLGELIAYDKKSNAELVRTLRCYLWNECSLLGTSNELHTHRNTIKYRVKRIEEITGKSLDSAAVRLEFMNALLCMMLCF